MTTIPKNEHPFVGLTMVCSDFSYLILNRRSFVGLIGVFKHVMPIFDLRHLKNKVILTDTETDKVA